ncbi:hypothetical protein [Amycolatopsis sp. NPDC059657]|uniref:hypothetical protein n=1 Tax=Amycolatopsis sp. NPDC059657 TaxID=3346899 RepID=UPI00366FF4AB
MDRAADEVHPWPGRGGILGVLTELVTTRWDAVLSDFRRYYQTDLRHAWRTMPAADVVALIRKLPADSALAQAENDGPPWGIVEENAARMLDIAAWQAELEWVDRITDPEDRAVKRERALAKRAGIKPPNHPIVPPVAYRPPKIAELRWNEYNAAVELYNAQNEPAEVRHVSSADFDSIMGLDS